MNVEQLINKCGIENCVFFTITFREKIFDRAEASRRWNSLSVHVLNRRFPRRLRVFERHLDAAIHFHGVFEIGSDVRTGFDFVSYDAARRAQDARQRREFTKRYAMSAAPALREEWRYWREHASDYGFGRAEILPIRSNAEAVGRYVGKYVQKHILARKDEDKGARLVSYSRGWKSYGANFQWNSKGAALWRSCLSEFAHAVGCRSYADLLPKLGKSWAHKYRDAIMAMSNRGLDEHEGADFLRTAFFSLVKQRSGSSSID